MVTDHIIRNFFSHINERQTDRMGERLTDGAQLFFPKVAPLLGRDRILKFFNVLFRQYSELFFEIHRIIIDGERAAVHWTNRGVGRKGEPYENEGVTLMEFEGDRVRFMSDFFKDTAKF